MARQITLKTFARKSYIPKTNPEENFINFLLSLKTPVDILILGQDCILEADYAHKKQHRVLHINPDFNIIKKGKLQNPEIRFMHIDFFSFVTLHNFKFDIIADIGFSDKLRSDKWKRFFTESARILKPRGTLFTMSASTKDAYCLSHCPQRKWTFINDTYQGFYTKDDFRKLASKNYLKITDHKHISKQKNETSPLLKYHIIHAHQTMARL
jgi:hypothetical protein